jgi:glycosyltransferase involved in cell wall biosynthesis
MSKKVAIIGPAWPFRGGLANFNERLAREWKLQGNDVTIHTFTKQYPSFLFPGTSQFTDGPAPTDLTIRRSIHAYNPLQWRTASNEIRAGNYDLVLIRFWLPAMGPVLGHIASSLVRSSSTKVTALVDNLYPHESRPLDRWLTNQFVRHPHAFVTMSKVVADQLTKLAGQRPVCTALHPIYDDYGSAIDQREARSRLGIESEGPVLLFFGFIRKYKGLDLLLKAIASDTIRRQNMRIVIAGEWYEDAAPYKALANSLGVNEMIIWRDHFIPESEISTYFSAADAVVQPYRNATQSGISALAFAYNKPLISTRVGGLSEIVDDGITGFLCDPDPDSIRDAIVRWTEMQDKKLLLDAIAAQRADMTWARLIDVIEKCQ